MDLNIAKQMEKLRRRSNSNNREKQSVMEDSFLQQPAMSK